VATIEVPEKDILTMKSSTKRENTPTRALRR
jgi:hypothetical protein